LKGQSVICNLSVYWLQGYLISDLQGVVIKYSINFFYVLDQIETAHLCFCVKEAQETFLVAFLFLICLQPQFWLSEDNKRRFPILYYHFWVWRQ